MPKTARQVVQAVVNAVVPPKPKPELAPMKVACSNCEDSGMTCVVCRTGYDV